MEAVDTDKNGQINYTEFIASSLEATRIFTRENIERVFKTIDKDKNGVVDRNELKELLQSIYKLKLENNYTEVNGKELDNIMEECDKNKDGKIDFN